jgi:hypothetical protein
VLVSSRLQTAPPSRPKILLLAGLAVIATGVTFAFPPFTRPPSYYDFADRREILGIPDFMDVASNAPWTLIGVLGLIFIARTRADGRPRPFIDESERARFTVLFGGLLLVAAGSAYFHLAPTSATLLWDRLPMSIVFMAFFSIVVGERIDGRAGRVLFGPLLALGIASVLYWQYTELIGRGDERLYVLVQFFPMLALPIILLLFPARWRGGGDLWIVLGWYALAKLFEVTDKAVFAATAGIISGHTLKHLSGVMAAAWLLRLMTRRRPVQPEDDCASYQRSASHLRS